MLKAASLFANVGIDEFYFKVEGVEVVLSNELLAERCKFYSHICSKFGISFENLKEMYFS